MGQIYFISDTHFGSNYWSKYRHFSNASEMDEQNNFISKSELYGETKDYYNDYNIYYNIPNNADVVYERVFRKAVSDFLYSGDTMLFRSATEGNFLVRLTDISLSPNTTLGRRLWSFSGTATEVAECTIENYEEYGIIERRN